MKTKLLQRIPSLTVLFFLCGYGLGTSQTLNKPTPADNPNQPGNSIWSAACASASFNEYFVNFTWSVPLVNSGNVFILELSNASGSFANPIQLASDNTKNTVFNFNFQFALPTDTRGEGYRMRVRSTNPAVIGAESDPIPMYFIDFNSPLLISRNGDGTIPSGGAIEICNGNSATLAVHNIPNPNTYRYNWYRSGTPLSEKGPSVTVNQAGIYSVEIDYGSICSGSANTLSNDITITLGTSLGIAINPPAKNNLCPGETVALVSNITGQGLTYTWYKDGVAITTPAVDNDTYTVNASIAGFEGSYQVEIVGPGTCLERSAGVNITNAGNFTVTRDNAANLVILPGKTETLSVSTSAGSVTYQWYRDGIQISGATSSTLNIAQIGTYFAKVTLTGGACATTSRDSEITTVVAPASFEVTAAYGTPYVDCGNTDIVLSLSNITAVLADNSRIDVTTDLIDDFTYQWKKDGASIAGATTRNMSLASPSENGNYQLEAVLTSFNSMSNTLPVRLLVNETLTISSSSLTTCNPSDNITISTATNLIGETYDWFYNGNNLNNNNTTLNVSAPGTYRLVISRNGCPLNSNDLVISPLDESLISLDTPSNVVFPEGSSRTITASGGTAYRWFDVNNVLLSSTASLTISEEGSYILIANIDACEITKQITATFLDTFKVPNVITINGDGLNDQWVIPNSYSRNPEINVIIYNDKGAEVFNQFDYQNNWPQSSVSFPKQNMVFFYKIKTAKEVLKQGTITVIR